MLNGTRYRKHVPLIFEYISMATHDFLLLVPCVSETEEGGEIGVG